MHPPVRDQDRPGHPGARFFGQRLGQDGHGQGARVVLAIADAVDAQFGVGQRGHFGLDRGHGGLGLRAPVAQGLAGAFVDDQDHDVRQAGALFVLHRGIGQRQQKGSKGQRPQPPAGQTAPQRQRHQQPGQHGQRPDRRPADQRREDQRLRHCPSLSSSAGTCTWSDL